MNKFYDKILFLLALIVLGLGAAFFFQQGGVPHITIPAAKPGHAEFVAKPLPPPPAAPPLWGPAPDQYPPKKEWVYSVFTPPIIWWDGQKFVASTGQIPIPFGLALTGKKRNYYRLEFVGYSGSPATPLINLHDNEHNVDYQVPQGTKVNFPGADVTVGKMAVTTVNDPALGPVRVYTVTVTDERTHKDLTLTAGQPLPMDDLTFLRFVTLEPYPEKEWIVEKPGEVLDLDDVSFQIKDFSIDPVKATVTKTFKNAKIDPANPGDTNEETSVLEQTTPPARKSAESSTSAASPAPSSDSTSAAPSTDATASAGNN
jgi:hypothetical protein